MLFTLTGLVLPLIQSGLLMLKLTYQMTDKVSLTAGVQNLFDTEALKIDGSAGAVAEGVPGNVLGAIYL